MLEHLSLADFKSFHEGEGPLGPFSLIVGTNASGKSNIREALRVLHGVGLGYPIAEILGEKYGAGGILQWRGIRGAAKEASFDEVGRFTIGVRLRTNGPRSPKYRYQITVDVSSLESIRVVAESLRFEHDGFEGFVFDSNPPEDPTEQRGDHQLRIRFPRGGKHRRSGAVEELSSARPAISQLATKNEQCKAVIGVLSAMRFLDLDPDAMRQASQPGQVILGDRGENLSSVLQAINNDPAGRTTLLEWIRALTPVDVVGFNFRSDFAGRILVHLVDANGFACSAHSASDGTLRFLALIAALLSKDSGRIYFFEEFDNGIHPTRLHLLIDLVQRACRDLGVQVIGTTHNPAMLAFLDDSTREDALLVYREPILASRIIPIMSLPDARRVLESQDLGRLHQAGWLEDAAAFELDRENT